MAAGVVTVTTLLWFVLPKKSRTVTLNSYVVAGERSRTSADRRLDALRRAKRERYYWLPHAPIEGPNRGSAAVLTSTAAVNAPISY